MNKNVWLRISGLALGAFTLSANAQFGSEPAKLDLIKIQDDVYVIHNDYVPGNTTALITTEGVILVDDKFEIDADNMVRQNKSKAEIEAAYGVRLASLPRADGARRPHQRDALNAP